MFNKQKYKAIYILKEGSTYRIRKKKRFNPNKAINKVIRYKGKPYSPDMDNPTCRKGLTSFYLFIIGTKNQIVVEKLDNGKEAINKDLMNGQEIIVQLFKAIGKEKIKINWIHLVFAIITGLCIGWIIGSFIPIGVVA